VKILIAGYKILTGMLDEDTLRKALLSQKNEITEHLIYKRLAESMKDAHNREVLERISADELSHYNIWKKYTGEDAKPNTFNLWKYYLISRLFGITFGIKLMEKGEQQAQINYDEMSKVVPEAKDISKDEDEHERQLISLIDEERLKYVGSVVLGLNDALVELTGALAGFTLALQNNQLIGLMGLITGIAAALSMAASEYLSTKAESDGRDPVKASTYTGIVYFGTVILLILPYFILSNMYMSLAATIAVGLILIYVFTYYVSVAKDVPFGKRFLEMAAISLGVAALTFAIGFLVRILFNVSI
jgi:VIT1/CCC1 family predicted Fe2+/Mn2+ transporter